LPGPDRFHLYLTAAGTGLRVSELASLLPSNFDLDAKPPIVCVLAAYTKNRKEVEQPLPPDVAEALRRYLAGRPADAPVWPGTWSNEASAKMIRRDLEEAREQWVSAVKDARQQAEREQSDFLGLTATDRAG
jgi:integrase